MSILPPRNNNIDATRSTLQKTVNGLLKKLNACYAALARKKKKLNGYNNLINFLILNEKVTRQEIKDYFKSKKENNEKLD